MAVRSLQVVITGDPKGFEAALKRASAASGAFATKQKSTSAKVAGVGSAMTKGITLPLVAAAAISVKFAADFEKQMSSLGAVTQASGKTMDAFRKQAIQAGADTAFSAGEAAQAQIELAKGGVSASNILNGALNGALALAAAGELELAQAAEITSNALNLFGLKGSEAGHVADAMAQAANSTTADVADFGLALGQAGSVAKSAGLNFDETMTALEALASNGIKGSDAGTSLKTSLIQLLKPTEKQAKLAKELGLNFLTQEGNMKSLGGISGMLREKLGGMTKAQRTATLAALAGTDGVRTLTALYDAGPKKLEKWRKGLEKQGTAAKVAERKQDNLSGKIEQLSGSMETLAIIIGSVLIPPLTSLAEHATQVANTIGVAFEGLPPQMQELALGFAGVLAAIGPLLWIGAKIVGSFEIVKDAFIGVGGALAGLSLPVVAVIAALAALAIGFVLAYKHSKAFRDAVGNAFKDVKAAVGDVARWLSTALPAAFEAVKSAVLDLAKALNVGATWDALKGVFEVLIPLVIAIGQRFMNLVSIVRAVVGALAPILGPVLGKIFGIFLSAVKGAVSAFGQVFRGILTVIKGILQVLSGILTGDFGRIWAGVKAIFSGALTAILGLVKAQLNVLVAIGRTVMTLFAAAIRGAFGAVKAAVMFVVHAIIAVFKGYVSFYRTIGTLYMKLLTAGIRAAVSAVVAAARWVAHAATNAFHAATGAASAAGSAVGHALGAGIRAVVGWIIGAGKTLAQGFVSGVRAAIGAVEAVAKAIVSALLHGIEATFTGFFVVGKNLIEGLIHGIESMASAAADAAKSVAGGALNAAKSVLGIGSPSKEMHKVGEWTIEGFANGMHARASTAKHAAASVVSGVLFGLEAQIAAAEKAGERMQEAFSRADERKRIAQAKHKTKHGDKGERAEAKRELRELLKEAERTQKLTKIKLQVEGLQKLKAFGDALKDIRKSLSDLVGSAGAAFREMKEGIVDSELNSTMLSLDTTFAGALARSRKGIAADPRVAELEALRAKSGASEREAQDAEITERLTRAKSRLAAAEDRVSKARVALEKVQGSGSEKLIGQAQKRLELAEASQKAAEAGTKGVEADAQALADKRRVEELETEIEHAQAIAEDRAEAQREGIAVEVAQFEKGLRQQFNAEVQQLAERRESYAQFVADIGAMLASVGIDFEPSAEQEAALSEGGGKGKGKGKGKKKKHRASGGTVMRRLGEWTSLAELGPELVERPAELFLPRGSRVIPASQSDNARAPLIGEVNIYEAQRLNEQALAERLGFAIATRGG